MPSDRRVTRALDLLAPSIEQYRAAVAITLEQVRGRLAAGRSDVDAGSHGLKQQLGPFAAARVDTVRLAAALGNRDALDAQELNRLQDAVTALQSVIERGTDLFHVAVPPGENLGVCVSSQLAAIGRAFAAARIAAAANRGAAGEFDEAVALSGFPFAEWSTAERTLAPPLVVTLNGADVNAGALAPLLDGAQKLLLIVEGACAPAPLVRLVSPGVLVIQAHDLEELACAATWQGPAVCALVPRSAACFVHDPATATLSVQSTGDEPVKRVGGLTAAQQADELRQLELLAVRSVSDTPNPESRIPSPHSGDAVDRLAAWLLREANLVAGAPGIR